jgi:type III secretion protein U
MSGDKTEQPTPKRRRDLRKKGQVPVSKEVASAGLTVTFFALFIGLLGSMIDQLKQLILLPVPVLDADFAAAAEQLLRAYGMAMLRLVAPFIGALLVVGTAAYVLQNGLLFSLQAVAPSLNKLNPGQYFKKTFSVQNFVEFGKSILKVVVLSVVLLFVLRGGLQAIVRVPTCGVACLREITGALLFRIVIYTGLAFVVVAAADFAFQRWNFTKKNMMSKDEIKREYKESEGDPLIKGKRRQLHQQLLAEGMVQMARQSTVLVTNPTHIAVAIYYDRETTPLPRVTAIGTDLVAKRMIEAATAAGVPVVQDVPLAHSLLDAAVIEEYIPTQLIEPLAEILRSLESLAAAAGG